MNAFLESQRLMTRRHFFGLGGSGIGIAALASLLDGDLCAANGQAKLGNGAAAVPGLPGLPHFKPRAKRVIYLFQSGAPSQMDLFDPKPGLKEKRGLDLPDTIRMG